MKTYFINKIQNHDVYIVAESINDLENQVIAYCEKHFGVLKKIYVHCSHVISIKGDEQNVEYIVIVNSKARTITMRRI